MNVVILMFTFLLPVLPLQQIIKTLGIRIVHHNDMLYRLSGYNGTLQCTDQNQGCSGGAYNLASAIMNLREEAAQSNRTMLYIYAGNSLGASIYSTLTRTKAMVSLLNTLKPDIMCLGMNDFDYGVEELKIFLTGLKIPIIASNIDISKERAMDGVNISKSIIRIIHGIQVGFVGYTNADTPKFSNSHKVRFDDELESVRRESLILKQKGVRFIFAIGNANYNVNVRIAVRAPLIDIVVCGTSYFETTKMWNMDPPKISERDYPTFGNKNGKQIPILQVYGYTKYLGIFDAIYDEIGNIVSYNYALDRLTLPTLWGPNDADYVKQTLAEYTKNISHHTVGLTKMSINTNNFKCYYSECLFGNLITDAMVEYMVTVYMTDQLTQSLAGKSAKQRHFWTETPIALIDAGTMSNALGINNGIITQYELYEAINNLDNATVITVYGKTLYAAFEQNVLQRALTRNFLHMSGLSVVYDYSKREYSRVKELKAVCAACWIPIYEPVRLSQKYNIIISGFTLHQVQGLTILKHEATGTTDTKINIIQMVTIQLGRQLYQVPRLDRRILVLNSSNDQCINVIFVIIILVVNLLSVTFPIMRIV